MRNFFNAHRSYCFKFFKVFKDKNSIYLQFTQTTGKGKFITNKKAIKNLKTKE